MVHGPRRLLVALALLLPWACPADVSAWSVTTHQIVAQQSAAQLPPGDLRDLLLQNQDYLRAGSLGPDLFYMPPMSGHAVFSDLAHYCQTNQLAGNMLSAAQSPKAKAFAYGWFSHNVTDSVAHPWVTGFTGQPYVDWGLQEGSSRDPRGYGPNSPHMFER